MLNRLIYNLKTLLNKPFKVGIISYYYPTEKAKVNNGVAIHAYYLSRQLANLGCEVHVFCRAWGKVNVKREYIGKGALIIHTLNTGFDPSIKDTTIRIRMSYAMFDNEV